jgi:hypothetical protein
VGLKLEDKVNDKVPVSRPAHNKFEMQLMSWWKATFCWEGASLCKALPGNGLNEASLAKHHGVGEVAGDTKLLLHQDSLAV